MALDFADAAIIGLAVVAVLFALLATQLSDLAKASIALGVASALLAAVFFLLDAPFAAVFELSVCAGLVTVLLLSAVNMTREKEVEADEE
jgi:NADH:ubiquinone oxidoreductase subunit 6 (subunit J)